MHDHLDFVVSQWNSAMPELDVSSMKICGRMLRLMQQLAKARSKALEPFGFREGEFDVLATLRRAGAPYCLSPGQLYKSLSVTSAAITYRLNRLKQEGTIQRIPDPYDKRSLLVGLTSSGQQRIEQALATHSAVQNGLLSSLSATQKNELETLLKMLLIPSDQGSY